MGLPKTDYTRMLIAANQPALDDLRAWIFHPGMLFDSTDKWWGDFGTREFPHEGIDLCLYRDRSGQTQGVRPEIRIPAMGGGIVRARFKDYLGQAIIIEHTPANDSNAEESRFLSVYAHTRPLDHIRPGMRLSRGDIIAGIADTRHAKARILPHLHLSLAVPDPDLSYEGFYWNIMRDPARITLINPMGVLEPIHHVPDKGSLNKLLVESFYSR